MDRRWAAARQGGEAAAMPVGGRWVGSAAGLTVLRWFQSKRMAVGMGEGVAGGAGTVISTVGVGSCRTVALAAGPYPDTVGWRRMVVGVGKGVVGPMDT